MFISSRPKDPEGATSFYGVEEIVDFLNVMGAGIIFFAAWMLSN